MDTKELYVDRKVKVSENDFTVSNEYLSGKYSNLFSYKFSVLGVGRKSIIFDRCDHYVTLLYYLFFLGKYYQWF